MTVGSATSRTRMRWEWRRHDGTGTRADQICGKSVVRASDVSWRRAKYSGKRTDRLSGPSLGGENPRKCPGFHRTFGETGASRQGPGTTENKGPCVAAEKACFRGFCGQWRGYPERRGKRNVRACRAACALRGPEQDTEDGSEGKEAVTRRKTQTFSPGSTGDLFSSGNKPCSHISPQRRTEDAETASLRSSAGSDNQAR